MNRVRLGSQSLVSIFSRFMPDPSAGSMAAYPPTSTEARKELTSEIRAVASYVAGVFCTS